MAVGTLVVLAIETKNHGEEYDRRRSLCWHSVL